MDEAPVQSHYVGRCGLPWIMIAENAAVDRLATLFDVVDTE
jgi:hypothetical protein